MLSRYTIRAVEMSPQLEKLDRRLFPVDDPYTDETAQWFVVEFAGRVVAYGAAKRVGRVVYLVRCGVIRSHRGRGLQKRLIEEREKWGRRRGASTSATYVASTNYPSLNSLIGLGYRVCAPSDVGWSGADGFLTLRRRLVRA